MDLLISYKNRNNQLVEDSNGRGRNTFFFAIFFHSTSELKDNETLVKWNFSSGYQTGTLSKCQAFVLNDINRVTANVLLILFQALVTLGHT